MSERHPSTQHMLRMLKPNPNLSEGLPASIAEDVCFMAVAMVRNLPDSPELTAGLRKLLEAKDCLVRAAVLTDPVDYRDR